MLAALEVSKVQLEDVRVVIFGSGTAGIGIADQIAETIATETQKSKDDASKQIWYASKWNINSPPLMLIEQGVSISQAFW